MAFNGNGDLPSKTLLGVAVLVVVGGVSTYFYVHAHHHVALASSKVAQHHIVPKSKKPSPVSKTAGSSATTTTPTATTTTPLPITPPKAWTKQWNQWGTAMMNQHFSTNAQWDWVANIPGSSDTYLWIVPETNHGLVDWAEQSGSQWTFHSAPADGSPRSSINTSDPVAMAMSLVAQLEGSSGQPAFPNGAPPAIADAYALNSVDSYSNVGLIDYQQIPAEPYIVEGLAVEPSFGALAQGQSLQSAELNLVVYATANGQSSSFLFSFDQSGSGWVWDGFQGGATSQAPSQSSLVPGSGNDGQWPS